MARGAQVDLALQRLVEERCRRLRFADQRAVGTVVGGELDAGADRVEVRVVELLARRQRHRERLRVGFAASRLEHRVDRRVTAPVDAAVSFRLSFGP